jgi:hypothetical protein
MVLVLCAADRRTDKIEVLRLVWVISGALLNPPLLRRIDITAK